MAFRIVAIATIFASTTACGYKGPLYMPEQPASAAPASAPASPATSTVPPALGTTAVPADTSDSTSTSPTRP